MSGSMAGDCHDGSVGRVGNVLHIKAIVFVSWMRVFK
jgi:hypothetical protein